jgi:hypothetical protein
MNGISTKLNANETNAMAGLKTLLCLEMVWQMQNPPSANVKHFWTYDISCLYRLYRTDGQTRVQFIDAAFARADAAPAADGVFGAGVAIENWKDTVKTPVPKYGYLYRVIPLDENGIAYNQVGVGGNAIPAANQFKFAVCSFPAEYGISGVRTFIVNEGGTVYAKDLGPLPEIRTKKKKDDKLSPEEEKKINELITQLGAEEWEKREAVQDAIIKIGKPAKPLLEKAKESKDPEVRMRVNNILKNAAFSEVTGIPGGIDRWPGTDPTAAKEPWEFAE